MYIITMTSRSTFSNFIARYPLFKLNNAHAYAEKEMNILDPPWKVFNHLETTKYDDILGGLKEIESFMWLIVMI